MQALLWSKMCTLKKWRAALPVVISGQGAHMAPLMRGAKETPKKYECLCKALLGVTPVLRVFRVVWA